MKLRYALALITILFAPQISHAQDPIVAVFRFSGRPPADVFANGFPAAGNDNDLLRFASGASLEDQTSAYIPTTTSMMFALDLYRRFHQYHPDTEIYLYAIRPTNNFHSLSISLHWAMTVLPDPAARREAQTLLLSRQRFHEWVAVGGITPNQIGGAQRLRVVNGSVWADPPVRNPNYEFLPPSASLNPLPFHEAVYQEVQLADGAISMFLLPASLNNMGCDGAPQSSKVAPDVSCLPTQKLSFEALRSKTIAGMIASDVLPAHAPV